jgi:uncharacterized protein (DUF1501 family)
MQGFPGESLAPSAGATRRGFLRTASVASAGLALDSSSLVGAAHRSDDRSMILLLLVGGPSQLETWDPKPNAPAEVRGPFQSIATRIPGVRINENLPRMAQRVDRLAIVRSLHHDAAPIHETGHQLVQTGKLCQLGDEHPHVGAVLSHALRARGSVPPFVLIPRPIGHTGVNISHGQSGGWLGATYDPIPIDVDAPRLPPGRLGVALDLDREPEATRDAYGRTTFGRSCLVARRLVEAGVRVVTINMFTTVFNTPSWDCHGSGPFSTLADYAASVLPTFDRAFSALLDDLEQRGRLESTLVVATGEFGRTPWLNKSAGRDHWPGVWSALLAGAGIGGGRVVGASDVRAAEPADRPVSPAELAATMLRCLGIVQTDIAEPVLEVFS